MKSNKHQNLFPELAVIVIALSTFGAIPVSNAATTWNVDSCSVSTLQSSGTGCGSSGSSVHAYAYTVDNDPATSTFASAPLMNAGPDYGLMVDSPDDNHALDNANYTDLIAFRFDTSVILDKITLGWTSVDADFSLFAWTGSGLPNSTASDKIVGKTATALATTLTSGWTLVGNYANSASSNNVVATVNAGSVSSSWWIVSAYNSQYGGNTGGGVGMGALDYMKVMTIASKDPKDDGKVSEPTALLLMGTALFGIAGLRRRRQTEIKY